MTALKMAPRVTSALNILLEDHIFLEYQDHILVITVISCHMLLTSMGSPKPVDDKQSRLQLKKLFHANQISSKAKEEVAKFAKTYCTEEKMILNEIHHMELLEFKKRKHSARKATNSDDENLNIDWENVYRERKLNKLKLCYIKENNIKLDVNLKKN